MRQELQPVHEDAGHHHVAQRLGLLHQGQMAGMQVAHGGHKSGALERGQRLAQRINVVDDLHGVCLRWNFLGAGGSPRVALVVGEAAGFNGLDIGFHCFAHTGGTVEKVVHKLGHLAQVDTQHVV